MTLPTRPDDRDCGLVADRYRLPLSFRGAKRRGNPLSFRPLRGRAVLRTAGVRIATPFRARNDSVFWLVLLLLPGQLSRLVGGGMPPALQGITGRAEKEKRLCPLILRDKGA